jgi:cytochrome P450 / NADPH-cytochrome P450 reductase
VLRSPARSGRGMFAGVCSNYIAGNADNSTVFVFVKQPTIDFRPPENPHVPMIMIGAGTGLAPFRGFLQERDALRRQGVPIGKSMLFFGCRHHDRDYLYEKELRQYEQDGVVDVDTVFSAEATADRKYVQHTFRERGDEVWQMLQDGANIYVCGNANTIAPAIRAALIDLYREKTNGSADDAGNWLADLRADGRYLEDVWGGNN